MTTPSEPTPTDTCAATTDPIGGPCPHPLTANHHECIAPAGHPITPITPHVCACQTTWTDRPTDGDPIARFQELSNHAGNPGAPDLELAVDVTSVLDRTGTRTEAGRGDVAELDRSLRQAQAAIEAAMDAARALLWQHGASDPGSGAETLFSGLGDGPGTQGPGEAHTATQRPVPPIVGQHLYAARPDGTDPDELLLVHDDDNCPTCNPDPTTESHHAP
jgi:hypothetical protein